MSDILFLDILKNMQCAVVASYLYNSCPIYLIIPAAEPREVQFISLVMWLLSCVMQASPAIQVISIAGAVTVIADIMEQVAMQGIKPLVAAMLTQPHVSFGIQHFEKESQTI